MIIKLSNGKEYATSFDVSGSCFSGINDASESEKDAILKTLATSTLFIRLEGDARPSKVIMKPVAEIDIEDFHMTRRGSGLILCKPDGSVMCSVVIDREEDADDYSDILYICSIYDTNCL